MNKDLTSCLCQEQRGKKKLISDILYRAVTIRQKCVVAAGELKRRSANLGFYEKFSLFEVELKKKKKLTAPVCLCC